MFETVKQKLEEILDKEIVIEDRILSEEEMFLFEKKFSFKYVKEKKY